MRLFSRYSLRLLILPALLLSGLTACTATRPQKLRLHVGEIKEIALRAPADTSRRLLATSDNPEVVDVSQRQAVAEGVTPHAALSGKQMFLLKGVTAGTVRVIFSEKTKTQGTLERILRTYRVEVVNR